MKEVALKILDLLERSVVLQAVITTGILGVASYIWVVGREMPDDLEKLVFIIISFWMGSKTQSLIDTNRQQRLNKI